MKMSFVIFFTVCLFSFSFGAPAINLDPSNVTSTTDPVVIRNILPDVTINLNCSCIISTSNQSNSKLNIQGLTVNGQSEHRCNRKAFGACGKACITKINDPIFNLESQTVNVNMINGVNLNNYLCGLMDKGDLSSMVILTTQMECIEKSTSFELFNSQSHSVSMSPSTVDCPKNTSIEVTTSTTSLIDETTTTIN